MLTIQSPQFSTSSKVDLFIHKRSPSYRTKRIPSAQDNYSCSSNHNLKISKTQSPSKISEERKRRKSQYAENNCNNSNRKAQKQNNQNIINSIQNLKEQYKALKQAYKQLIQEKTKSAQFIKLIKQQNSKTKQLVQEYQAENLQLKNKILALQRQKDEQIYHYKQIIKRQKSRVAQIQNQLLQQRKCLIKSIDFENSAQEESRYENPNIIINNNFFQSKSYQNQQNNFKSKPHQFAKNDQNQSKFLSFSLTSIMEDSESQDAHTVKRKKQHIKVISELSNFRDEDQELKEHKNKQNFSNFKKVKNSSKLELNIQNRQSKLNLLAGHFNSLLPKTPNINDKKNIKAKTSKSNRKKQDKENINDTKNSKKKSKKNDCYKQ